MHDPRFDKYIFQNMKNDTVLVMMPWSFNSQFNFEAEYKSFETLDLAHQFLSNYFNLK